MASLSRCNGLARLVAPSDGGAIGISAQEKGVFLKCLRFVVRTDGEDSRQSELKLLNGHGLKVEREVEGRDRDSSNFLPWVDKGLLDDADIVNAGTRHNEVLVGVGDVVPHAWHLGGLCLEV